MTAASGLAPSFAQRSATALVIALGLLLLGQAPPEGRFTEPAFGKTTGPYRMGLSIAEDAHPGRRIPVHVVLENVGATSLDIGESSSLFPYDCVLVDEAGKKVDTTAYFQRYKDKSFPTSGLVARLAPGNRTTNGLSLNLLFDTTLAGRYRLTVSRQLPVGKKAERVTSAEIAFELTEEP